MRTSLILIAALALLPATAEARSKPDLYAPRARSKACADAGTAVKEKSE